MSTMAELALGLHWKPEDIVIMLWAYLDESGIHDDHSGHLKYLAVGGAIAQLDNWLSLENQWRALLDEFHISQFHMSNFEANDYEFDGWSEEKHKNFLNRLLKIIHDNQIRAFFGAGTLAPSVQTGDWFPEVYKKCVSGLIPTVLSQSDFVDATDRNITLVFAKHHEINFPHMAKYFEAMSIGLPKKMPITIADPSECPNLQVADMVLYETVRWLHDPNHPNVPTRYPLQNLYRRGASVYFRRV